MTQPLFDARGLDDALSHTIAGLPAASIDHLGMHADRLPQRLRLVEQGIKVEATGFGRVELDPVATLRAIIDVDPTALMVGADLPSTPARRPFQNDDIDLIVDSLPPEQVSAVLWDNASAFYLGS
ncbi:hypothetical protein [Citricoccus muralis]|uniref:hypothetical protein n=1 Tax=Citricoccus muralis TaxID=169134 RepID=UPI00324280D3